jgi:FkbM family methyltransferase
MRRRPTSDAVDIDNRGYAMKDIDFERSIFSWEGEDVLIYKISRDFLRIDKGFYVDVGAHHPFALSNTHLLYRNGWRGINIDAMPGSMRPFNRHRRGDINIEMGVSLRPGVLRFSMFDDPALNGFLSDDMVQAHLNRGIHLIEQKNVECQPLKMILQRVAPIPPIDLLTIDAEGLDIEVIKSNDFRIHRPKLILTEILGASDMTSVVNSEVSETLVTLGYRLFSRLHFSVLFIDAQYIERTQ